MAGTLLYVVVFFKNEFYANTLLQFVFIGFQVYGWRHWQKLQTTDDGNIQKPDSIFLAWLSAIGLILFAALFILNILLETKLALPDAFTTAMSVCAQYMLARKYRENWYLWIVADVIYVAMFTYQGLYATATLYFILLVICFSALRQWKQPSK